MSIRLEVKIYPNTEYHALPGKNKMDPYILIRGDTLGISCKKASCRVVHMTKFL